jgi:hypothetical protein
MNLPKYLLLCWLLSAVGISYAQTKPVATCKEFDLKLEVVSSSSGKNNGEIKIITKDTFDPMVHLISRDEQKVKQSVKSLSLSSITPGNYILVVSDYYDRYCPKSFKVTIH